MPVIIKESEPIDYRKVELGIDHVDLHDVTCSVDFKFVAVAY